VRPLGGARKRSIAAAAGLTGLLAAIVAGVVWLTGTGTGNPGSATPAQPDAGTRTEIASEDENGATESPAASRAPGEIAAEEGQETGEAPDEAGTPRTAGPGCGSPTITPGRERASAAAVTADYRFQHSLTSSVGAAPDLVEVGSGSSRFVDEALLGRTRTVLRLARRSGLVLAPTTGVIDSRTYTIELVLRLRVLDGWRKIIDFKNASDDSGLYNCSGRLSFFPIAGGARATIEADAYVHVALTRDASGRVAGYVNGVRQFSFRDTQRLAVIDTNDTLLFLRDDSQTGASEYSPGAVSRIRLYDRPLSGNEVARACAELPGTVCGLTRPEYLRQAYAVCRAANETLGEARAELDPAQLDDLAALSEEAARISEETLAELRALPVPNAARDGLAREFALREQEIEVLDQIAAAAAAGDAARVETLSAERLDLTHQRGARGYLPPTCPVSLGG
jgi:hypothetical protein